MHIHGYILTNRHIDTHTYMPRTYAQLQIHRQADTHTHTPTHADSHHILYYGTKFRNINRIAIVFIGCLEGRLFIHETNEDAESKDVPLLRIIIALAAEVSRRDSARLEIDDPIRVPGCVMVYVLKVGVIMCAMRAR